MPHYDTATQSRTILGHPPGLFILFFTEMWERFSYYGMRALLVLFMVDHLFVRPNVGQQVLGFNAIRGTLEAVYGPLDKQPLASLIYGLYTAFVYLMPLIGGIIADRWLGRRKSVVIGAVLMAIGHFLMTVENLFFIALLFLILGNGAFKPNISTQVGDLYPPGDLRRDRAFTIFYMGINLGAFFSPLICGTLGQKFGWHYGFGAAGVGMVAGLLLYLWGQRFLAPETVVKAKQRQTQARRPLTRDEWRRVWALVALCALNIVFWGVYEQQGNTLQLWADRNTNWSFFSIDFPSTWYQSFNPMIIILFAPVLNLLWGWQARRGCETGSVSKMAIGCFLLGASFLIMIAGAQGVGPEDRRSVLWLLSTTFVFTIGELYLSPVGLSLVTKVAPARIVSTMMGVWFLSYFFGNYLSGFLGTFWEKIPRESFFCLLSMLGIAAGLAIWTLSKPLKAAVAAHE